MSILWQQTAERTWKQLPLNAAPPLGLRFCPFGRGADRGMALLLAPDVRVWVNGLPVLGGLRVLEHKDEILLAGARLYFSAEATPVIATFQNRAGERIPSCPICRGQLKEGDAAVQCPGCGRWHHQLPAADGKPAKACWTYAATCRFCGHPTALTGQPAWRPEMEEHHG
jgi:hypothetical protein